jgi:hypothetical protein
MHTDREGYTEIREEEDEVRLRAFWHCEGVPKERPKQSLNLRLLRRFAPHNDDGVLPLLAMIRE